MLLHQKLNTCNISFTIVFGKKYHLLFKWLPMNILNLKGWNLNDLSNSRIWLIKYCNNESIEGGGQKYLAELLIYLWKRSRSATKLGWNVAADPIPVVLVGPVSVSGLKEGQIWMQGEFYQDGSGSSFFLLTVGSDSVCIPHKSIRIRIPGLKDPIILDM